MVTGSKPHSLVKPSKSFIDTSLKNTSKENLHLSFEVSIENFTYCITDKKRNIHLALEEYFFINSTSFQTALIELKQLIDQIEILKTWKYDCSIAVVHKYATIVPNSIFKEDQLDNYLDLSFNAGNNDFLSTNEITNINSKNVFSFPSNIHSFFAQRYKNISFKHYSTSLLENLILQNKNRVEPLVVIHVQPSSSFEIIVFADKTLKFYNAFHRQTNEDFIYFVLFVFEQLKLDSQKEEVKLIGDIDKNSPLFVLLEKYIKRIHFDLITHKSPIFKENLSNQYFNILSQYMCE